MVNEEDDPNVSVKRSESFKYNIEMTRKTPANVNAKD